MGPHTAHKKETRSPVSQMAEELQAVVGQRLVAYATGKQSPQIVGRWARGLATPHEEAEQCLRALYRTFLILSDSEQPATIRAWLLGANPQLADAAPIEVIREGESGSVFRAAEAFVKE